jgi:hypothetical protein
MTAAGDAAPAGVPRKHAPGRRRSDPPGATTGPRHRVADGTARSLPPPTYPPPSPEAASGAARRSGAVQKVRAGAAKNRGGAPRGAALPKESDLKTTVRRLALRLPLLCEGWIGCKGRGMPRPDLPPREGGERRGRPRADQTTGAAERWLKGYLCQKSCTLTRPRSATPHSGTLSHKRRGEGALRAPGASRPGRGRRMPVEQARCARSQRRRRRKVGATRVVPQPAASRSVRGKCLSSSRTNPPDRIGIASCPSPPPLP